MSILDFLFPKRCLGCGRIGRYICALCRPGIRNIFPNEAICPVCERAAIDGATHPRCRTRYSPDGLTSFFRYDGVIRNAIKTLKYRFISDLGDEFVSLVPVSIIQEMMERSGYGTALVPIPLHRVRQLTRGFNQAEVLGKFFAKRLHMPMRTDMLRRIKKTTPQVDMRKREDRLKNMEAVFGVDHSTTIQSRRIVLFDDVFTTGATMRSAANVLKRQGIQWVWCVTMAR